MHYSNTDESANLMLWCELQLPDQVIYITGCLQPRTSLQYIAEVQGHLEAIHQLHRENQAKVKTKDNAESPCLPPPPSINRGM